MTKEELNDFVHALRTPLGVALNICRDASLGLAVDREDFLDAEQALEKMRQLLEQIVTESHA